MYDEPVYLPLKKLTQFKDELYRVYRKEIPNSNLAWKFIDRFIDDLPRDKDDFGNCRIMITASTWHSRETLATRYDVKESLIKKVEVACRSAGIFISGGAHHGQTRSLAFSPQIVFFATGINVTPKRDKKNIKDDSDEEIKGYLPGSKGVPGVPDIGGSQVDPYRISSKGISKVSSKGDTTTTTNHSDSHEKDSVKNKTHSFPEKKKLTDIYRDQIIETVPTKPESEVDESEITEELKTLQKPENEYLSFLEYVKRSRPAERYHFIVYHGISGIVGEGFKETLRYFKQMAAYKGIDYVRCYLDVLRQGAKELARRNGVKMYTFNFSDIVSFEIHKDVHAEVSKILKNEKP